MTEQQLLDAIVETALYRRWSVHHQRPARLADGSWRSAIQGTPGFPDLILSREGRTIAAELKSIRGIVGQGQVRWLDTLAQTPGLEVYLWRPPHWTSGAIDQLLAGRPPTTDPGTWIPTAYTHPATTTQAVPNANHSRG